jgi:Tol biopolymer transport system component
MLLSILALLLQAQAPEARLVRYPHVHGTKVAFTYLGDIWTAGTDGSELRRLTVHTARDAYPRFSPDAKWIAFSSDRFGNFDVFIVPAEGGMPTRLTWHSAGDLVLGWTPDGSRVLFSSNRSERFGAMLYTVDLAGGMPVSAGADIGVYASYSPDGTKLAFNRMSQVTGEGLPRRQPERRHGAQCRERIVYPAHRFQRNGQLADVGPGRVHLFRQRQGGKPQSIWYRAGRRSRRVHFASGTCWPANAPTARPTPTSTTSGSGS